MENVTPFMLEMTKRGMKHFVNELKERDDFEVNFFEGQCANCNGVAIVPRYRINGHKDWISVFSGQNVNCKVCIDQKELAKVFDANKESTNEYLMERFEKEYWEIPSDLREAGFKNFRVEGNSALVEAKRVAINYVKDFMEGNRYNMLIMGNPGSGKTHLVTAIARTLKKEGFLIGFLTTGKLISKIQSTFNKGSMKTKEDIYRDISRCNLLILDDLGSEAKSKDEFDWSKKELFEIVNLRIGKPTIYTSNFNEKHLPTAIGMRTTSRLYKDTKFIEVVADDYRKKLKK